MNTVCRYGSNTQNVLLYRSHHLGNDFFKAIAVHFCTLNPTKRFIYNIKSFCCCPAIFLTIKIFITHSKNLTPSVLWPFKRCLLLKSPSNGDVSFQAGLIKSSPLLNIKGDKREITTLEKTTRDGLIKQKVMNRAVGWESGMGCGEEFGAKFVCFPSMRNTVYCL